MRMTAIGKGFMDGTHRENEGTGMILQLDQRSKGVEKADRMGEGRVGATTRGSYGQTLRKIRNLIDYLNRCVRMNYFVDLRLSFLIRLS